MQHYKPAARNQDIIQQFQGATLPWHSVEASKEQEIDLPFNIKNFQNFQELAFLFLNQLFFNICFSFGIVFFYQSPSFFLYLKIFKNNFFKNLEYFFMSFFIFLYM